jgi:hypothetical protein
MKSITNMSLRFEMMASVVGLEEIITAEEFGGRDT